MVSLNYFGAVALATGLRPLMGAGWRVGLVSSNSVTCHAGLEHRRRRACLDDDEEKARTAGRRAIEPVMLYPATKAALA